jgi:hypothetical protein
MLIYWGTAQDPTKTVKGIELSKSHPKHLRYDITSDSSKYSWEVTYADFHILKPSYIKTRFTKIDYYIRAIQSKSDDYLITNLIELNPITNVIMHIEDLNTNQKEFLILQF